MSTNNQTVTREERNAVGSQSTHLAESTVEDFQILQHRVGLAAWCSYAEGDAADAKVMALLRKIGRCGTAARLHIVDRATQGLDDGDWQEVAYGYLYGSAR